MKERSTSSRHTNNQTKRPERFHSKRMNLNLRQSIALAKNPRHQCQKYRSPSRQNLRVREKCANLSSEILFHL